LAAHARIGSLKSRLNGFTELSKRQAIAARLLDLPIPNAFFDQPVHMTTSCQGRLPPWLVEGAVEEGIGSREVE